MGTLVPAISATWDALGDGTSCEENGQVTCADGTCEDDESACPDDPCESCEFDWTNYGSACCDTAWGEFGIDCATLESNYGWDCAGCACPGDGEATCGDGVCSGDETFDNCPADCDEPVTIPDEWTCPESYYTDSWCDCGCGAYDPTCDDPDAGLWDNCAEGCVDPTSPDCNDAVVVDCDAEWDACVESLAGTEYYEACGAEDCDGGPGGSCDGNVVPFASTECGWAAQNILDGVCPDPCPTDGSGLAECADDYCPDGTYFDGWSCYDCEYCLNTNDDSACGSETGNDCCGACGGSNDGDCDDAFSNNGNISFADTKAKVNAAQVNAYNPTVAVNIATGEITYSDDYVAGSRAVSYLATFSCEACFDSDGDGVLDDWSGSFSTSIPEMLVFGFTEGDNVCVTVSGSSTELGVTAESGSVCAEAGEAGCDDLDADGICDDVDDCVGSYDDCGVCNGDGSSCAVDPGDANADGSINILDITLIVGAILNQTEIDNADMNGDGNVNILDITLIVGIILNGDARSSDATSATMEIANGTVSISGNGFIGAVQMTLSHDAGFSIDLTNDAMIADYRTNGNTTTLIVVAPNSDEIFTAKGDFTVEETIVANENGYVPLSMPTSFTLSAAYPNPFNPSTSLDLNMPSEGFVSIQAYNLVGQVVGTIAEGNMIAGTHSFTWDASDLSSGVYLVRPEYAGRIETQKVMLLK
jgi:hypothetical protein